MERVAWSQGWKRVFEGLCVAALLAGGCAQVPADDDDGDQSGGFGPGLGGMTAGMQAPAPAMAGTGGVPAGAPAGGSVAVGAGGMMALPMGGSGDAMGVAGAAGAAGMAGAAGVGGLGGVGGMAGMDGTAGMVAPMHMDLGQGDGQDVITIGDSWMNLILTGIEQSLEKVSMRDYRNFAVPGTLVLNEQIPGQYASAKAQNPNIKTVIMTGGGNDILTSPCTGDACQPIVDDVSARLTTLMMEMGTDGVEDVVLIGYTYPADMGKHASLDYSIMLSSTSCVTSAVPRCHFIDSTKLAITLSDGIHPNAAGYDLIGQTVWELLQAQGIRR